ncbi:hypothetical protein EV702DRAFT_1102435 [Suillus placidus]|uniref:Secreted protein n=1 Tax=Suillus placidus TaxID=48579 RepID=A0A9P6ZW30_9AGAM|nr:hypothetical protein EV702DRAFT_1102435 [Suillus placidus]
MTWARQGLQRIVAVFVSTAILVRSAATPAHSRSATKCVPRGSAANAPHTLSAASLLPSGSADSLSHLGSAAMHVRPKSLARTANPARELLEAIIDP